MNRSPCTPKGLSLEKIDCFREQFHNDPRNLLAQNISTLSNPLAACLDRETVQETSHVFVHKVPTEGKPITNQQESGRCWIFSCLNVMRLPFMKKFNLEEFEFSQSYLFFWDKVERCYYTLHAFLDVIMKKKEVDGRLVQSLLTDPITDGGQWHMLVNLVEKYGVIPKTCFPESYNSEASNKMDGILKHMMRSNYGKLNKMVAQCALDTDLESEIDRMIEEVYRVVCVCLGCPPKTFEWVYRDKDKKFGQMKFNSPLQFYKEHVKPLYDMKKKICLVNDPRTQNPCGKVYTVEYLCNMVGGLKAAYNNQPIEVLKQAAARSIKDGEAVWFGCDIDKYSCKQLGISDLNLFRYELLLGISMRDMTKEERVLQRDSSMNHAMVLVGFTNKPEKETEYEKWKVENSWGEDSGNKGYMLMADDWFSEYVYEVVVDPKYLDEKVLSVMEQKPVVLPAWDPMANLA